MLLDCSGGLGANMITSSLLIHKFLGFFFCGGGVHSCVCCAMLPCCSRCFCKVVVLLCKFQNSSCSLFDVISWLVLPSGFVIVRFWCCPDPISETVFKAKPIRGLNRSLNILISSSRSHFSLEKSNSKHLRPLRTSNALNPPPPPKKNGHRHT